MTWPEVLSWEQAELYLRRQWEPRVRAAGRRWDHVQPAFRFGWEWGRNTRFTGHDFEAAEPDLVRFWKVNRPSDLEWQQAREWVRDGWQRARHESWGHNWRRATW